MSVLTRRRQPAHVSAEVELPGAAIIPIAEVQWRAGASGGSGAFDADPAVGGAPTLECTLIDATGGVAVVFLGRREVAGIHPGTCLAVEGMVGEHNGRLAILNPAYDFVTS